MYSDQLGSAPTLEERRREPRRPPVATRSDRRRRLLVACGAGLLLFVAGIAVGAVSARYNAGAIGVVPVPAAAPATVTVSAAPAGEPGSVTRQSADPAVADAAVLDPGLADVTITDGDWFIGAQVRPGSYRNTRLSGTSGTMAEIIANGIGTGVVTIEADDYAFTSNRCNWAFLG